MLSNFITYIQEQKLFWISRDKLLLAVSGGMDSIAMVHFCKKAGIKFGIAHCNFQLRGAESDGDAAFVAQLATSLNVPYHSISFETEKEAKLQKKSIQVVARDLRYKWMENIRQEFDYAYISVAHHHNDSIETLLLNLTMGCGIRGLHGILPKNGFVIRPLLFATREDIHLYIQQKNIDYREDSSNASTKYSRNALRHLVVPELQKINPKFEETFEENFLRFREAENLYRFAVEELKKKIVQEKEGNIWINIQGLIESPSPQTLLYEILHPFNFKSSKVKYILKRFEELSGAIYTSKSHRLLKNRTHWIVSPIEKKAHSPILLPNFESEQGVLDFDGFKIKWHKMSSIETFEQNKNTAYFDFDQLNLPLQLRHWKDGDLIYPLGMNGKKKKLSKFFKDIKLNRFEKDKVWLLCSNKDELAWAIGLRADERFKVTDQTKNIIQLSIIRLK